MQAANVGNFANGSIDNLLQYTTNQIRILQTFSLARLKFAVCGYLHPLQACYTVRF